MRAGIRALLLCVVLAGVPARAQPLIADVSNHLIAITTGFVGTEVLVYGATDGEGDVVILLRGPEGPAIVRRKGRVFGIWVNRDQVTFPSAPSFYRIAASRPLEEIAPAPLRTRFQMGLANLRLPAQGQRPAAELAEFRAGLVRDRERAGLYSGELGRVTFLGPRLFRTRFTLPANVPPGQFTVEVLLVQAGTVTAAQTTPMLVGRVGVGAEVYDFAQRRSALYGVLAVLIAVGAGWSASAAFRKG